MEFTTLHHRGRILGPPWRVN